MRQDAQRLLGDALDVLRSDWDEAHGPTPAQALALDEARHHIGRAERIGVRGYAQRKPVPHGTNAGYQAHLRNGTPACDPCREAKRISTSYYKREREMAS
jgi:hypothetical protein